MSIPFTQFMRPDGRPVRVSIDRPNAIVEKAQAIIGKGYRFECEHLSTGHVSLTITDEEEGDLDIEVVPNGPRVPEAVDLMVERFYAGRFA